MDDTQTVQYFIKQAANSAFAKHLVALQVTRGDDEVLQRIALQVIHHHVDGLMLAEEVEHADHARMADLRQGPAFLEEALEPHAVQGQLLGLDTRREFTRCALGQRRRQILLDGHAALRRVLRQIYHAKTTSRQFLDDLVAPHHAARRQRRWFGL